MKKELIEKIMQKKEFSQLPKKDVELVFNKFDRQKIKSSTSSKQSCDSSMKEKYLDEEKVKLSRDLLRKMYTAFVSPKLLNIKDKDEEWFLKKHISTKERFEFYEELYEKLLKDFKGQINLFDLGAGINGFSYKYFKNNVNYIAVEAVGQLVNLMNNYFEINKLTAKAIHESLFELEKIKKIVKKGTTGVPRKILGKDFYKGQKGNSIIFLFKTLDSLEMLERDYSKKLLKELVPLVDKVVVSFATRSLVSRRKFNVKRDWIINFIKENFNILDDFELGNERYISFRNVH